MTKPVLTPTLLRAGVWEGQLRVAPGAEPAVTVTVQGQTLADVSLVAVAGQEGLWHLRVPIGAEHISDGVQTFVISDAASGDRLGHFALVAGSGLEDDIRAEIDLLRAELDMLKKAFRRHCIETM